MEQLAIDIATKFTADVSGLTQGAQQAAGAYNNVAQSQTAVAEASTKASGGVKLLGTAMKGLLALGVVKWLQGTTQSFEESERASAKLSSAMANNADMAKVSQDQWEALAAEVQTYTKFSDEAAMSTIALYGNMGMTADQIQTLLPLTADLAEKLGTDMEGAAMRVTRAMQGQARSLQMAGIDMRGLAEASDKTAFVMERLDKQVGGFAKTTEGFVSTQLAQLGNMFDDIKEKIGAGLAPAIVALVKYGFKPLVDTLSRIPAPVLTAGAAFAGLLTVGKALTPVFGVIGNAFSTLGKLGSVFGNSADTAAQATDGLGESMDSLSSTFSNSNTSIQTVITRMSMMQSGAMASASSQEKLAASMLMSTSAAEQQNIVAAVNSDIKARQVILEKTLMTSEEARAAAINMTTAAYEREAAAMAAANAAAQKSTSFVGKLGTVLGAVGVVAAVATVAWAAGSAALGYFRDQAAKAREELDALRTAFIQASPDQATAAFESYGQALLRSYPQLKAYSDGSLQAAQNVGLLEQKLRIANETGEGNAMALHFQLEQAKRFSAEMGSATSAAIRYSQALHDQQVVAEALAKIYEGRLNVSLKHMDAAQARIVGQVGKLSDSFSLLGVNVGKSVQPIFQAQQELAGFEASVDSVAESTGASAEDIRKAMDGDAAAMASLNDDAKKFAGDFISTQGKMADAALTAYSDMKKAVVDWENQFSSSINTTIDRFAELASNGEASYGNLVKAMEQSRKQMERFGHLADRIFAAAGKDAKPFLAAMTEMGVDAIPIMAGALEKGKKGVDGIVSSFNQGNKYADSLADSLSKTLFPSLKGIAAGFAELIELMGGEVPPALAKAASAGDKAKSSFDELGGSAETSRDKVSQLHDELTQLPSKVDVGVTADTSSATSTIESWINNYENKTVRLIAEVGAVHSGGLIGFHSGGAVEKYHSGGPLKNDERLAVLQTGEFVIQRSAVKKFGRDFFSALNKGAPKVYRGTDMSMKGPGGGRDIHMDIEVNPVIDREQFIKGVTYSTKVTGR